MAENVSSSGFKSFSFIQIFFLHHFASFVGY